MKKLSREHEKERSELVDRLNNRRALVEESIAEFNTALADHRRPVDAAIEAYNEAVEAAKDFADRVAGDAQAYYDDRSERWQEGDAGAAYADWINAWETASFDNVEVEIPADLEEPDMDHATDLDDLPTEPG